MDKGVCLATSGSWVRTRHGHGHDLSYDTSTGGFQEADSRVIYISCDNLLHNRAKINMFKLIRYH